MGARHERWATMNAQRNSRVLDAACDVALEAGLAGITRERVASVAGVSVGSVSKAFGVMERLRDEVVRVAIARPILPVLAQALASGHPLAKSAPDDVKRQALDIVT